MIRYLSIFIIAFFSVIVTNAQIRMHAGSGLRQRFQKNQQGNRRGQQILPSFKPAVDLSVGYGFPNQDKNELVDFYNYYKGTIKQNGPLTAALDYHFTRSMSIGVLVAHGEVTVPYFDYNNPYTPALKGSLENWAFMLNIIRYIPVNSSKISPYLRTAIGINTWTQNYTDESGNKLNTGTQPGDLAYQAGIGAKFNLSKRAGIFVEAGYGKYILHGGLTLKF